LNEYENTDNWENRYQVEFRESKIISKKFWFIKWLVENDKVLETEVRPIQIYDYEWKYCDDEFWYSWFNQWLYYRVIMELAISDTPIEDLISYLK
jgi:hypothetical protein